MKAASASKKKGVLKKTRNSRTIWNYHIMVLIGMVWLFFFNIVPMFGIVIAFEDYNLRLAFSKNGKVFVRSGAGIVADSVPEKEYRECIQKAAAVRQALQKAQEGMEA